MSATAGTTITCEPLGHIVSINARTWSYVGSCPGFTFEISIPNSQDNVFAVVHNKAKLEELISGGADISKVMATCVIDLDDFRLDIEFKDLLYNDNQKIKDSACAVVMDLDLKILLFKFVSIFFGPTSMNLVVPSATIFRIV